MRSLFAAVFGSLLAVASGTPTSVEVHDAAGRSPLLRGTSLRGGKAVFVQTDATVNAGRQHSGKYVEAINISQGVYGLIKSLDKLRVESDHQYRNAVALRNNERLRLSGALATALSDSDRMALQTSVQQNEENEKEAEFAYREMLKFYYTTTALIGGNVVAPDCSMLQCGEQGQCIRHASEKGFTCACKPCFKGNGYLCRPTTCTALPSRTALPLFVNRPVSTHMKDVHMSVFSGDHVAIVYRDESDGNVGKFMLGNARESAINWGRVHSFSKKMPAFSPKVLVLSTRRLVISFRDANHDGIGMLTGGKLIGHRQNTTVTMKAYFKEPVKYTKNQAQHTVLVPLANSRVACLYAYRGLDAKGKLQVAQGHTLLMQVLAGGSIGFLGRYIFSHAPVTQITAVSFRPTSFVIGFRSVPVATSSTSPSKELSAMFVSMEQDLLITDKNPLVLEPDHKNMYLRDLALISENLIQYSYQSGSEKKTKMQIIRVDPKTHGMEVMDGPKTIGLGDTTLLSAVSQPFLAMAPHTLTCMQHPHKDAVAQMCRISPQGQIAECEQMAWTNMEVSTVTAARISDGRLLFVFANMDGKPFYQLLGAPS